MRALLFSALPAGQKLASSAAMTFLVQLVIGTFMIGLTVGIHAFALDRLVYALKHFAPFSSRVFKQGWKTPVLMVTVLGVFTSHIAQIWLWALLYLLIGVFHDLEYALYFSTTMFTTLGLGDIVLGRDWRLLSVCEAANGFILFGWSTAFIFEIMTTLYKEEMISIRGHKS
jgi:hypothetical protein